MVIQNRPVIENLRAMVSAWSSNEMARWEVDDGERLTSLVSCIVAFLDSRNARQARWRMMRQLASQPGVLEGLRFIRREVRQGLVDIIEACEKKEFRGMFRCAKGVQAGKGFCAQSHAADAWAAVDFKWTRWG